MAAIRRLLVIPLLILSFAQLAMAKEPDAAKKAEEPSLAERLQESTPGYTEAQAQAYVREMAPLVEKAAGRKFKSVPKCKLVRRDALIPVLAAELAPQIKLVSSQLTDEEAMDTAEMTSEMMATCFLGKYGTKTKILYLLPRNLNPLMDVLEVDSKYRQPITKLVVAHELAHAMHDQYADIAKQQQRNNSTEKLLAFSATVEGFAMFITDKVAADLNMDDAAVKFAETVTAGTVKGMDPAAEVAAQPGVDLVKSIYSRGRDFIAWKEKAGGMEQVWQTLANPPASTSTIFHPEAEPASANSSIDYAAVLKGLEKHLGKQKWTVENEAMGEMEMRSIYATLDEKNREMFINQTEHVQRLLASDGRSVVHISIAVLKDSSPIPTMLSVTESATKANFEKMSKSETYKIKTSDPVDFINLKGKADIARRFTFTISLDGESAGGVMVQAARGRVIAAILTECMNLSSEKIAAIIQDIFSRLPQDLLAKQPAPPEPTPK